MKTNKFIIFIGVAFMLSGCAKTVTPTDSIINSTTQQINNLQDDVHNLPTVCKVSIINSKLETIKTTLTAISKSYKAELSAKDETISKERYQKYILLLLLAGIVGFIIYRKVK